MATQVPSSLEAGKLKNENDTLRKRILLLEAEIERLRRKLEMTWGEA